MTSLGGVLVAACGTDGEPDPQPDAGGSGSDPFAGTCETTSVQIGSNHSHTMVIEPGDLDSTSSKDYDITGGSDHPHTVTITASQFRTLKETGVLMVTSTNDDGHTHSIRVRCTS